MARASVRPLVSSPVTPNHLTALRLATGLGAAAAFAVGDPVWSAWGAALYLASTFLDRADGELARLESTTSAWGHRFDMFSDTVSNTLVFLGIGIGLRDSGFGLWAVVMGLVAGIAVATVLMIMLRMEEIEGERAGQIEVATSFDADDALLLVPVLIWIGWSEALILAASIGAPAFAVFIFMKFRDRLF
jgi:phosphatidylglycerophosphate synthase